MEQYNLNLPQAYGAFYCHSLLKQNLSDFIVEETLPFELSGEGEHVFFRVQKEGHNTRWVVKWLADRAKIAIKEVGYSGLKDRYGICQQWFSLKLPLKLEAEWNHWQEDGIKILETNRHRKKLKIGTHKANRFKVTLRQIKANDHLQWRLEQIKKFGFPNYFGLQRFGHNLGNLVRAEQFFSGQKLGRQQKSLAFSAARSWIFNQVLANRVQSDSWRKYLKGDVLAFFDSNTLILPDKIDASCLAKIEAGDLLPTGPMWGEGELMSQAEVALMEKRCAAQWPKLADGLIKAKVLRQRRHLSVKPSDMHWLWSDNETLVLDFTLKKGNFALALVHELTGYYEGVIGSKADHKDRGAKAI